MKRAALLGFAFVTVFALMTVAAETPAPKVVDLTSSDGIPLKATYFDSGKPGPGVLLLHQCNMDRSMWNDIAPKLAALGLNVLTLDYRGFGESGGKISGVANPFAQLNSKFPLDVDAAFAYLMAQPGVKKDLVGAAGASCGVNQTVQLARRHPEVKAIALLSGTTDHDGRTYLTTSKLPVFVAVADDDGAGAMAQNMDWLIVNQSLNQGTKFQHYQSGGHGAAMFKPHPELPGMVIDWFKTTMLETPGKAPTTKVAEMDKRKRELTDLMDKAEAKKASAMMKKESLTAPDPVIASIGTEHVQSGDSKGAVEIYKLDTDAYPDSATAFDGLAGAYLAAGQQDQAKQSAEKALSLLASDTKMPEAAKNRLKTSLEDKLKKIGSTTDKGGN